MALVYIRCLRKCNFLYIAFKTSLSLNIIFFINDIHMIYMCFKNLYILLIFSIYIYIYIHIYTYILTFFIYFKDSFTFCTTITRRKNLQKI